MLRSAAAWKYIGRAARQAAKQRKRIRPSKASREVARHVHGRRECAGVLAAEHFAICPGWG